MAKKEFEFQTTYAVAVDWLRPNLVLCNELPELDESVLYNMDYEKPETDNEDEDEDYYEDYEPEIYQWYITDLTSSDVEWLKENFDLIFSYSDLLGCYVLCVAHYGTSWSYVPCGTNCKNAECEEGTRFVTTREMKKDY